MFSGLVPDGTRIANGSWDRTVQIWNARSGSTFLTYKGHRTGLTIAAWSPDGKYIASGSIYTTYTTIYGDDSYDITTGDLQIWDAMTGVTVYTQPMRGTAMVAWSPDGKYIASCGAEENGPLYVQDTTPGKEGFYHYKEFYESGVVGLAWSPNGRYIATSYENQREQVKVWNPSTKVLLCSYSGHSEDCRCLAWSPDGKQIASGGDDSTVHVWNVATGSLILTYHGHADEILAVAWSSNGRYIASGSCDKTVQVWDATDGGHVYTYRGHSDAVTAVAWSPDGTRIASGSSDHTVQVWGAG